jgi:hypothetical protein
LNIKQISNALYESKINKKIRHLKGKSQFLATEMPTFIMRYKIESEWLLKTDERLCL